MDRISWLVFIPVFLPFLGLFMIIKARKNYLWMKRVFSIAVALLVFAVNAYLAAGVFNGNIYSSPRFIVNGFLQIYLSLDGLGAVFSTLASFLWIFVTIYSFGYMRGHARQLRYFAFFTVCLGITMGIAYAGNLFTLYIFYEMLTLATYPLVIHKEDGKAHEAGKKYLIYAFSGAALILAGMILLSTYSGTLDFVAGGQPAFNHPDTLGIPFSISFILFFFGFGVKAAIVPLHSWLPLAMVAPTPVSALLHAVAVVKAGVFSMARVVYYIIGTQWVSSFNIYFLYIIAFSILFGSVLAIGQDNLKKRLAYSTISQLGYVLLGIVLANPRGYTGGILHLVNHALIKIVLFLCAGCIMRTTGKTEISQMKGIGREMPVTMTAFGIASVCLVGIPPTNGFVSKWYLSLGSLDAGHPFLVAVLLISALLTAAYLFPIVGIAFFTKTSHEVRRIPEVPSSMYYPLLFLCIVMTASGLFSGKLSQLILGGLKVLF